MLLRNYKAEIVLPRCDPDRETLSLIGHLASAASPVSPYLNATQPGALFSSRAPALRFRFEGRTVTLQPDQVAAGGLAGGDAAVELLSWRQRIINDAWSAGPGARPAPWSGSA